MALSHKQVSKRGGDSTFKKHGRKQYSTIGKKGVAALRQKRGPEYFVNLAKMGLAARLKKKLELSGKTNTAS